MECIVCKKEITANEEAIPVAGGSVHSGQCLVHFNGIQESGNINEAGDDLLEQTELLL